MDGLAALLSSTGQLRIPEMQIRMACDGAIGCKGLVEYAVRVWVPSKTPLEPGHEFLRMTTNLHCCALHRGFVDRESFVDGALKSLFEDAAKRKRPLDFRCEFDKAFIDYLDVRSDEYRQFLASPKGKALVQATAQRPALHHG